MRLAVPTWRRSSRSIASAWQSFWAMPRLPAGFEVRSCHLGSTTSAVVDTCPVPATWLRASSQLELDIAHNSVQEASYACRCGDDAHRRRKYKVMNDREPP